MQFDWDGFETELTVAAVNTVRALLTAAPHETPYAVAFSSFYAETAGVIYLPALGLATEESVDDPDCRFSPPDWAYYDDTWSSTDSHWEQRLCTAVANLPRVQWEQAWDRFAQAMLNIAARTRKVLSAEGSLPADAIVFLDDEECELLARSVTSDELRRHFPAYAEAADAEQDILAMPHGPKLAELAAAAGLVPGPPRVLGRERALELLLDAEHRAVAVAITALAHRDTAWAGAKLLADLNIATPEVIAALWGAIRADTHGWVATALGRLGAGAEVLARRELPASTRGAAVTAPYTSFRDHGRGHAPLDYALLAAGLADQTVAEIVTARLEPGSGYSTLDHTDLAGARAGLERPEPVIRRHAAIVVGDLIGPMGPDNLDPELMQALCIQLTELAADDPDSEVRRLAGYRR